MVRVKNYATVTKFVGILYTFFRTRCIVTIWAREH